MRNSTDTQRLNQIGLDRLVRFEWLEKTAQLVLAGNSEGDIKSILQSDLADAFPGSNPAVRGSLDKTVTILMRTWVRPPADLAFLHQDALELLSWLPRELHLAIHWGMLMAVYPFWGSVAAHVGRLLRLQRVVVASQVQQRVKEQYGERETAARRARYVLRSFVDWGVLEDLPRRGEYRSSTELHIDQPVLIAWLIEALLWLKPNGLLQFSEVASSAGLFPFRMEYVTSEQIATASGRIEVLRQGLNEEMLYLKH